MWGGPAEVSILRGGDKDLINKDFKKWRGFLFGAWDRILMIKADSIFT